jgi:hypothetical protein
MIFRTQGLLPPHPRRYNLSGPVEGEGRG